MPCSVFNHVNNSFCTDEKTDQKKYSKQVRNWITCFLPLEDRTKIAGTLINRFITTEAQTYIHTDFICMHTNAHKIMLRRAVRFHGTVA